MVAPSQRRQPAGDNNTRSFEVRRKDGPSLGRLTLPCINELIGAGLLSGHDIVDDPKAGLLTLQAWAPAQDALHTAANEVQAPAPARPTLVEATYDPTADPDLLGEYSIDVDGPLLDGVSVDLETLVEDAQARISGETAAPRATPPAAAPPQTNAEWSDFDPFEDDDAGGAAPVQPQPKAAAAQQGNAASVPEANAEWTDFDPYAEGLVDNSAPLEPPRGSQPALPNTPQTSVAPHRRTQRSRSTVGATKPAGAAIPRVTGAFVLLFVVVLGPALWPSVATLGLDVPVVFAVQNIAILIAGLVLMTSIRTKLTSIDFGPQPMLHYSATIAVGILLGLTLPSLGVDTGRGGALIVRLSLACSLEAVFRGSFDRWLSNRPGFRVRTSLISGLLFGALYAGALTPWAGASARLWGSSILLGILLAWGGVATKSSRLVTLCSFIAAFSAAFFGS